jgi:GNAT superfamily N-acetyltransferase
VARHEENDGSLKREGGIIATDPVASRNVQPTQAKFCELAGACPDSNSRAVSGIKWRDFLKQIFLTGESVPLEVPRSACVSKGDLVKHEQDGAWVECSNGLARILPSYAAREELVAGNLILEFAIKEITDAEEFAAYQALSEFHYRERALHGRTARLIVRNFHPIYPKVVGYIELATPFYMNKARAAILDAPFAADGIEWDRWNVPTMRRFIHLIVRIARCVIYPEFRGVGLGQVLLKHAAAFARERWQIAGLKALFLEDRPIGV